jgi:SAM-dependent methyltransferase
MLQDLLEYMRAKAQSGDSIDEFFRLFRLFLSGSLGGNCLRLVFSGDDEPELGPNWATLDLSQIEDQATTQGAVSIDLADDYFDAVLVSGLERVSRLAPLIAELRRVLRPSGQIWVQVPLCTPFRMENRAEYREYWRLTPEGLRVLFEAFDEIFCSVYNPGGSSLRAFSFYYGMKPPIEGEEMANTDEGKIKTRRCPFDLSQSIWATVKICRSDGLSETRFVSERLACAECSAWRR